MNQTDDDRLAALQNLMAHGPQVLSATEVLRKARELIGVEPPLHPPPPPPCPHCEDIPPSSPQPPPKDWADWGSDENRRLW